mgnify:CR=1 FL=1
MRQNEICPRRRCLWARFDGSRTVCLMPACREAQRRAAAEELARAARRKREQEGKR